MSNPTHLLRNFQGMILAKGTPQELEEIKKLHWTRAKDAIQFLFGWGFKDKEITEKDYYEIFSLENIPTINDWKQ